MNSTAQPSIDFRRASGTLIVAAVATFATVAMIAFSTQARAEDRVIRLQFGGANRVVGSGNLRTEVRPVSGFRAVAARGSVNLVLRQGTREGVELSADDNLLALIETRVVDRDGVRTLEIGAKQGTSYSSRNPVVASVDLIALDALAIEGSADVVSEALKTPALKLTVTSSGDVRLRQLSADNVSAKIAGSGDIELSGRTGRLALSIAGSGDANTRGLEADDVNVSIAGSGDASVVARKTLTVSIAGSGDVDYAGDAAVKSAIAGSGSVKKR